MAVTSSWVTGVDVDASDLHSNVVHALQSGLLLAVAKSRSNETGSGVICLVVGKRKMSPDWGLFSRQTSQSFVVVRGGVCSIRPYHTTLNSSDQNASL